ncbi:MAG: restriction endonuclease subunit S, partial [Psychroserpens sp.]|nr:restriction endonuclease subunit S [Psychroserpens sp.]
MEPASELLKRIQAEKQELIAQKKFKKEKPLPKIEVDEMLYTLPNSWEWCRFGDIGVPQAGYAFKSKFFNSDGIGFPLVRIRDLRKSKIETYYSGEYSNDFIIENGDYLVGMDGNFNIALWDKGEALLNQRVCRLNFIGSDVLPDLIVYSLQFRLWALQGTKSYTTVDHLSAKQIKLSLISLPPLEEQKAIVEIVNELFAAVEQLEAQTKTRIQLKEDFVTSALQRLTQAENVNQEWQFLQSHFTEFFTEKENIKQLRDTILQLAVQGKLTSKWRSENPDTKPASELLKRIHTEKQELIAQKKIRKEKSLPPVEKKDIPTGLPIGWSYDYIRDVSSVVTCGIASTPTYTETGRIFLSAKNVKPFTF